MLSKFQKLILGIFILLLVDIIWVSSSELTKFIYQNETYEKPFFTTYVKTSMFTIYLIGLCIWPPWKHYCQRKSKYTFLENEVEEDHEDPNNQDTLSPPSYVPVKWSERGSGTESDDSSLSRAVRFCHLAEVRQMSDVNASDAVLARLSYQASLRAGSLSKRVSSYLPLDEVMKIAFIFCALWFLGNYTFQVALLYTKTTMVSVLSSSSSLFTLILSAFFPANSNDKFTISKLLAVITCIIGLVMVSYSESSIQFQIPMGILLSLLSAFFYAAYVVFFRRMVENEEKVDIPLFFGFVGLFNFLLLWPFFFILHYIKLETFEWPNKYQLSFILINGLIGSVLSEVLWLWGCMLTSSLIGTVALSFTIPLSLLADSMISGVSYSFLFYVGTLPVIASFFFITLLAHWNNIDPIKYLLRKTCRISRESRLSETEIEQRESLIDCNENLNDA